LVYRVTGAEDRRYNKVYLTSQGESTYKKLLQIAAGALSKAKNNIPGAEIESCIRVLHKVSENLQRNIEYLRKPKI
jgi:DNA-binding MarR family transcriptional regulator